MGQLGNSFSVLKLLAKLTSNKTRLPARRIRALGRTGAVMKVGLLTATLLCLLLEIGTALLLLKLLLQFVLGLLFLNAERALAL